MSVEIDWDIVGEAFYSRCDECTECEYFEQQYYTGTGLETSCRLLDMDGGDPKFCPAYERLFEEMTDNE
jgi:hypothetical protein